MTIALFIVSAIALVLFGIALFLGKEMFKKFRFMQYFVLSSGSRLDFRYKGAKEHGWNRGMRNIVIRAKEPFSVLVGFELTAPVFGTGFDYYGMTNAYRTTTAPDEYISVISTYLGNGSCMFQFLLNCNIIAIDAKISSTDADQELRPMVTYPPHFYQQLGFYA